MYNIILSGQCNLRCDYCFARERLDASSQQARATGGPNPTMNLGDYARVLAFLKASKVPVVSLLGGEPSLHPDFAAFVDMALKEGFVVSIKSNATWKEKILKEIRLFPNEGVHYLLNINNPRTLGEQLWMQVSENVRQVKDRDVDFQLNIDRPGFEYAYLLELARETRPQKIVWSLSNLVKGTGADSFADPLAVRAKFSKRILDFVVEAGKEGIQTLGVHGITPCMFAEQDYQVLLASGGRLESTCRPVFDILPDLSVLFCFPVGEYFGRKQLENYRNLQELNMDFMEALAFLRSASYPLAECFDCQYSCSQVCHGGCIARHLDGQPPHASNDEHFLKHIPMLSGTFQVEKRSTGGRSVPGEEDLLVDMQSKEQYPIERSLLEILAAADGCNSLGEIYQVAFKESDRNIVMEQVFREVILQLLKRGVLALRPFRKTQEPIL